MNMHRNKTGPILPVVLTALTLLFGVSLVAEEVSDFDALLRNALESQKKESSSPQTTKKSPAPLTPAAPKQTMQLPPKTDTAAGWVAVESNSTEKPTVSSFAVADSRNSTKPTTSSGASVWDAVPETVPTKVAAVEPKKTNTGKEAPTVSKETLPVPVASAWDNALTATDTAKKEEKTSNPSKSESDKEKSADKSIGDAIVKSTKKSAEKQPIEKQLVEKQPAEKQVVEKQPIEKQLVEKQPVETQLVEKQPIEKQLVEKQPIEKQEEKVSNWDAIPITASPSTDSDEPKTEIAKKEDAKADLFVADAETDAKKVVEPKKADKPAEKSDEKETAKVEPKKADKPAEKSDEKETAKVEPDKVEPKKEETKKSDAMSATLKKLEEDKEDLAATPAEADGKSKDSAATPADADGKSKDLAGTPATADGKSKDSAATPATADGKSKDLAGTPADADGKSKDLAGTPDKDSKTASKEKDTKKEIVEKTKPSSPSVVVVQPKPRPKTPDFDSDETTIDKKSLVDADRVGDPNAADKIRLMYNEIMEGLKVRSMTGKYEMWKNYARTTLRGTSGTNTGSEIDGRYRLSWYQRLYDDPIRSVIDVEDFSRQLHDALCGDHRCYAEALTMIRKKLDVPERNADGVEFLSCATPYDALNEVKRCLLEAQMHHARALSTLTMAEQNELAENLVPTFSGSGCVNGHTIPNRTYGRRLADTLRKTDRTGFHDAAEALVPLTNKSLLALLDLLPEDAFPTFMLNGQRVQRFSTSAGDIIIGGRENNMYDLDSPEMRDVVCVIDLGGNDTYREGTCDLSRPVLAILDLHGSDTFTGSKPGIQGGSVLGVSIVVNAEGNNTYSASDVAQGSTIGGAGMLFNLDENGNDSFKAVRRAQGHALGGLGVLVDRGGNDKFRAALWAQGFGAPGGFGVLENVKGNDTYYCGGLWIDSYPEHPGYDGWGQGIGAGIRQVANGGIGVILDGAGDDLYEVDYFGHGGGYWLGVGFARDFGGSDRRMGTTLTAYDGSPRREAQWTRFSNGFGCHYSLGYLFDDGGDDYYGGRIMGGGMAWDLSIGFLCDFDGNDKFDATGGMTQGVGAEGSIGVLYCYGGDDVFNGRNQAYANGNITYHAPSNCGSNFSFLINYGGQNKYGCGARPRSYTQRGTAGGYLIDRPTQDEAVEEEAAFQKLVEERQKQIEDFEAAQEKLKEELKAKGRRYYPPRNRPLPISPNQRQSIGAVPSFGETSAKTGANESTVK